MTKEDVERTAHALRDAYARMRGFYSQRGYYHSRDLDEKHWRRIAPAVLTHGINPQHFVKFTFEYFLYELRKPAAWVQNVASQKAIDRYIERQPKRHEELKLLLGLQVDTITVQLQAGRTPEEIIKDHTLELNAVVRYALALKADLPELAAELRSDAELDLKYEPQYQQFVSQWVGSAE